MGLGSADCRGRGVSAHASKLNADDSYPCVKHPTQKETQFETNFSRSIRSHAFEFFLTLNTMLIPFVVLQAIGSHSIWLNSHASTHSCSVTFSTFLQALSHGLEQKRCRRPFLVSASMSRYSVQAFTHSSSLLQSTSHVWRLHSSMHRKGDAVAAHDWHGQSSSSTHSRSQSMLCFDCYGNNWACFSQRLQTAVAPSTLFRGCRGCGSNSDRVRGKHATGRVFRPAS